jgi:hypothetical protein
MGRVSDFKRLTDEDIKAAENGWAPDEDPDDGVIFLPRTLDS